MSEVQRLLIEENGEVYEIYVEAKDAPSIPPPVANNPRQSMGANPVAKLQQAQQMIRGYTVYALRAFKEFKDAEIESVTLKFGIKIGLSTGIPYITEGKADSNLEVEVKCKFPNSNV
ncbi:CU044_2847 family protein [Oscillatoria sp. FACHB-1406]|uniref:CU044_2847 family protein n=1 Tax=Oscillatoria sp. FACHB-1406 TaxID=2692846 RepID=UPI0016872E99|nr:CU044_2847 family protein [Oscillatoria sp. FACHB-1406]MBD2577364.1 hypothetical protein [Oscillatoria sp. FACHB-1406]